jgi:hypothetical protein
MITVGCWRWLGSWRPADTSRRHAHNHDALAFQQATGGVQEARAVINDEDETAQCHHTSIAPRLPAPLAASRKLGPRQQERQVSQGAEAGYGLSAGGFPN